MEDVDCSRLGQVLTHFANWAELCPCGRVVDGAAGLHEDGPRGRGLRRFRIVVFEDKPLTRRGFVIEIIVGKLKNISQIEHTRHRGTRNSVVNLVAGPIACTWQSKRSSLHLYDKDMVFLPAPI